MSHNRLFCTPVSTGMEFNLIDILLLWILIWLMIRRWSSILHEDNGLPFKMHLPYASEFRSDTMSRFMKPEVIFKACMHYSPSLYLVKSFRCRTKASPWRFVQRDVCCMSLPFVSWWALTSLGLLYQFCAFMKIGDSENFWLMCHQLDSWPFWLYTIDSLSKSSFTLYSCKAKCIFLPHSYTQNLHLPLFKHLVRGASTCSQA